MELWICCSLCGDRVVSMQQKNFLNCNYHLSLSLSSCTHDHFVETTSDSACERESGGGGEDEVTNLDQMLVLNP